MLGGRRLLPTLHFARKHLAANPGNDAAANDSVASSPSSQGKEGEEQKAKEEHRRHGNRDQDRVVVLPSNARIMCVGVEVLARCGGTGGGGCSGTGGGGGAHAQATAQAQAQDLRCLDRRYNWGIRGQVVVQ